MEKKDLILTILLLFLILILIENLMAQRFDFSNQQNKYAYTKTICTQNSCKNYYVECNGRNLISATFTGHTIKTNNSEINLDDNLCN